MFSYFITALGKIKNAGLLLNPTKKQLLVTCIQDCIHYDQIFLADLSTLSSSHLEKATFFSFRFISACKANSTTPSNHAKHVPAKHQQEIGSQMVLGQMLLGTRSMS